MQFWHLFKTSKNIFFFVWTSIDRNRYKVYADIEGFRTNAGGTIPPEVLITTDRPDLVIVDEENKKVKTFELTVPHISNIEKRHELKTNKYQYLENESNDYSIKTEAFEVEIRGYISKENKKIIKEIYKLCSTKDTHKEFQQKISKLAINGSSYIYMSRSQKEWADLPLLKA